MEYTPDQKAIVDLLYEQLDPNNSQARNIAVSGRAGCGKTAMLCQFIVDLLKEEKYSIAVCAMTGKATSVIRGKIHAALKEHSMPIPKKDVLLIETVQKLTKESKVLGLTESGDTLYTNTWRDPKTFPYDILCIDEVSMIPGFLYDWWKQTKARVFVFGDQAQLPAVVTPETTKEISDMKHDLKMADSKMMPDYGIRILRDKAEGIPPQTG